ncbi:uncharacterized protein MELLADRAFT_111744 [Melampsora larici-populina 98AG31]|uniref:Uncharacterized protein n=1 Tax=Melampsora larici-populina (strain 98AG31 / pathotype 3-4-7) TaxID=747676 RepID=F4S433_MELLP|nr:uncharacterized protein MELLADRAFT_111744 [Melampsora larici-populina 98AG31]EGG00514.1 hypothetical protein MELLADRAFT_111744 [Melampsora larici-populina 98AG31]
MKHKEKQKEGIITEDDEEGEDEELNGIKLIENSNKSEFSKVIITVLPEFYIKYCHDLIKLFEILRIPKLLYSNLYLELYLSGFLLGMNNDQDEDGDGDKILVDGSIKKQVHFCYLFDALPRPHDLSQKKVGEDKGNMRQLMVAKAAVK